jgi:hypothetical protein
MATWPRSKLFWGILLTMGVGMVVFCRGRDHNPRLPPADDAFISYHQSAVGLARLALEVPPASSGETKGEQWKTALEGVESWQAEAENLPADELQRLRNEEPELVALTSEAWHKLAEKRRADPDYCGELWPRIEAAFRLCREMNPIQP